MSGSSGGCVGEGGLEEDPDIPMHRKLETMKMNKIHFNLDTMVQNITLIAIHETGQFVLSSVFHGHIRQLEKKLKLFHSRNVTHKRQKQWQDFRYCANRNGEDDWVEEYPISMLVVQFISSYNPYYEIEGLRQKSGVRELPCSGR